MESFIVGVLIVAVTCSLVLGFVWTCGILANNEMYAYVDSITQTQLSKLCENDDLLYLGMSPNQTSCPKCSLECYSDVVLLHFQIRHQSPWQNRTRIVKLYLESRGFTVYEAWQGRY